MAVVPDSRNAICVDILIFLTQVKDLEKSIAHFLTHALRLAPDQDVPPLLQDSLGTKE